MKKKNKIITALLLALAFCILIIGVLLLVYRSVSSGLDSQRAAQRWGNDGDNYVQLSLFLDRSLNADKMSMLSLENKISEKINEQVQTEKEDARNFISTYSAKTEITAENEGKSVTLQAYFTSDDFFHFHFLDIVSGWYYNEYDIMDDGVLINTFAAWKLFGGYDLSDMQITLDGYPCMVYGVFDDSSENPEGVPVLYADYDLLYKMGKRDVPITCFEAVLPEPVKNFAQETVVSAIEFGNSSYELVNNTKRYNFKECFLQIPKFFTRTDRDTGVYFPKWENEARRTESICILLAFFVSLFSIYPALLALFLVIFAYVKKRVIFKHIVSFFKRICRHLKQKIYEIRNRKSTFRKDDVK